MVRICPVSSRKMNENVTRMNAAFTVFFVAACLFTGNVAFTVILFFDFLLRNIYEGRLSPVIHLNQYMVGILSLERRMINAGPKIFAARVGLFLSALAMILMISGSVVYALIPIAILGLFSFLELVFGYCVACKLYPYILPVNEKLEQFFHSGTNPRT